MEFKKEPRVCAPAPCGAPALCAGTSIVVRRSLLLYLFSKKCKPPKNTNDETNAPV